MEVLIDVVRRWLGRDVIASVRARGLTYLDTAALRDLDRAIRSLEAAGRDGMLIEAGCALGGAAVVMARAKSRQRLFHVYDVFGMIPPPSDRDGTDVHRRYAEIKAGESAGIDGAVYYGYQENLVEKVTRTFADFKLPVEQNAVHLIKGLFEDTLAVPGPVLLAHIDCDWYESVMTCLERITPHLVPGGVLVIDDYDAWSGCRQAVDEYFADKWDRFEKVRRSRLHIVRMPLEAASR